MYRGRRRRSKIQNNIKRAVEGVSTSMIYSTHCKCYNVPPASTTIKKET
jgi:hypothetical protein